MKIKFAVLTALFGITTFQCCFGYTEIITQMTDSLQQNGGLPSNISETPVRRYDDSNSEIDVLYVKDSIFYRNVPKDYAKLSCLTNRTVVRDYYTYDEIGYDEKVTESFKTGWILTESGKKDDLWVKVFVYTNSVYQEDTQCRYGRISRLTSRQMSIWKITIKKSSGMPKNPSWLKGIDDSPNSQVFTENTDFPVSYGWLRQYFPDVSVWDLPDCAYEECPLGMPYWIACMLKLKPENPNHAIKIQIWFKDGKPQVGIPVKTTRERDYGYHLLAFGKDKLTDAKWTEVRTQEEVPSYHFFKAVLVNEKDFDKMEDLVIRSLVK